MIKKAYKTYYIEFLAGLLETSAILARGQGYPQLHLSNFSSCKTHNKRWWRLYLKPKGFVKHNHLDDLYQG